MKFNFTITYPTTLDTLSNPTSGNGLNSPDHATQHADANDAIEALEAKVGINGSAVTTSHDYKLSGVTGSDKAVSKTGTETLTNKTLTSPVINLGTNATGDIYYRDSGGLFARLAIGSASQILQVSSGGIPEWIANPSASAASTTTAGIVELATTAETTTGTDATRAVTPQGLHDMTSLAGATWFLDEDTMSSDSATKTASQQSIKAYVDSQGNYYAGIGISTASKTYNIFQIPWLLSTDVPTANFWTTSNRSGDKGVMGYYFGGTATGDVANSIITTNGIGIKITSGSATELAFGEGKDVICEFTYQRVGAASEQSGFGFVAGTTPLSTYNDTTTDAACFTIDTSGNLYGHTCTGAAQTNSAAISGVTLTNNNTYRIEVNDGVDVKFYVNGVLKATNTTNLPNSGTIKFGIGCSGDGNDNDRIAVGPVSIAVEK